MTKGDKVYVQATLVKVEGDKVLVKVGPLDMHGTVQPMAQQVRGAGDPKQPIIIILD
jgi:hypothetical protein